MAFWLTFRVGSVRICSSSAHLETQISENSLRSSSSSIHFERLFGSVEAMNRLYSSMVGGDQDVGADRRGDIVVGQEEGEAGHVAVGAVGVSGADGELLGRTLAIEDRLLGIKINTHDLGQLIHVVVGHAGLDPSIERL